MWLGFDRILPHVIRQINEKSKLDFSYYISHNTLTVIQTGGEEIMSAAPPLCDLTFKQDGAGAGALLPHSGGSYSL